MARYAEGCTQGTWSKYMWPFGFQVCVRVFCIFCLSVIILVFCVLWQSLFFLFVLLCLSLCCVVLFQCVLHLVSVLVSLYVFLCLACYTVLCAVVLCICFAGAQQGMVLINHPLWLTLWGPLRSFPHSLLIAPAKLCFFVTVWQFGATSACCRIRSQGPDTSLGSAGFWLACGCEHHQLGQFEGRSCRESMRFLGQQMSEVPL